MQDKKEKKEKKNESSEAITEEVEGERHDDQDYKAELNATIELAVKYFGSERVDRLVNSDPNHALGLLKYYINNLYTSTEVLF